MSRLITSEIEELVESLYRCGGYEERSQVLVEALRLLKRRTDVMRQVQQGLDDLDTGFFTEYDESSQDRFRSDVGGTYSDSGIR